MKKISFKAWSIKNPDRYVIENGRLRGCNINDPIIIYGRNIKDAEFNLKGVKDKLISLGVDILDDKIGSFSIEVDNDIAFYVIKMLGVRGKQ